MALFLSTSKMLGSKWVIRGLLPNAMARTAIGLRAKRPDMATMTLRFNSTKPSLPPSIAADGDLLTDKWDSVSGAVGSVSDAVSTATTTTTTTASSLPSDSIGYLNSIGLAQNWYWPPDVVEHLVEMVHVYTGTPWWASIVLFTVVVRAAMFPLFAKSSDNANRMAGLKPELEKLMAEFKIGDQASAQNIMLRRKQLLAEHGVSNKWLLMPMVNLPISLGMFFGFDHMGHASVAGFESQGALWFQNLSAADPYLGLHLFSALTFTYIIRAGGDTGVQAMSPGMQRMFIILPFASIFFTMSLPASCMLYLAATSAVSVVQASLLRSNAFRTRVGLSPMIKRPPPDPAVVAAAQKPFMQQWKEFMEAAKKAAEEAEKNKKK